MIRRVAKLYDSAVTLLNYVQSPLLLAIRLYWGWEFIQDGLGKLNHLDKVTDYFTTLNLPQPHMTAIFVSLLELIGGALFALGIGTRLISLLLFVNMTVAYLTAEPDAFAAVLSNPDKFTGASAYNDWFATLIILIMGPGYLAVDTILRRFLDNKEPASLAH
jgi:putative oxidoreductase